MYYIVPMLVDSSREFTPHYFTFERDNAIKIAQRKTNELKQPMRAVASPLYNAVFHGADLNAMPSVT